MIVDKVANEILAAERALSGHVGQLERTNDGYDQLAKEVRDLFSSIGPNLVLDRLQLVEGVGVNAFWYHKAENHMRCTLIPQAHWI